jgi:hypothetical protein
MAARVGSDRAAIIGRFAECCGELVTAIGQQTSAVVDEATKAVAGRAAA